MRTTLTDHAKILNAAGKRHQFPVRDPASGAIGFAAPGELEGRRPIGWNEFFPEMRRSHLVVILDDEAGSLSVAPEHGSGAQAQPKSA